MDRTVIKYLKRNFEEMVSHVLTPTLHCNANVKAVGSIYGCSDFCWLSLYWTQKILGQITFQVAQIILQKPVLTSTVVTSCAILDNPVSDLAGIQ